MALARFDRGLAALKASLRLFRLHYVLPRVRATFDRFLRRQRNDSYDLVFVVPSYARGWILEAICHEIAAHLTGRWCLHYSTQGLPTSHAYFFAHQPCRTRAAGEYDRLEPSLYCVHTHPSPTNEQRAPVRAESGHRVLFMFLHSAAAYSRRMDRPWCPGLGALILRALGPTRPRVTDCAATSPKSPDLMVELVRSMPHQLPSLVDTAGTRDFSVAWCANFRASRPPLCSRHYAPWMYSCRRRR